MEQHAQDLVEGLMAAGHKVSVITTPLPRSPALTQLQPNGLLVELQGNVAGYKVKTFTGLAHAVQLVHQQAKLDLIHAQGFMGIPLTWPVVGLKSKLRGNAPPVVHSLHGTLFSETPLFGPIYNQLSTKQKLQALYKFKHRLAFWPIWEAFLNTNPNLITDSKFSQKLVQRNSQKKPTVIPLGISAEFLPIVPAQGNRLLFVGRLEDIKNAEFALKLMRKLPTDFQLDVVGEGPVRPRLEALIAAHNLTQRVKCWGRVDPTQLNEIRQKALLLLNPDGGFPAFGLVNAEALCQGLPVLTTPHGAHSEVVSAPHLGSLLPLSTPVAWIDAIIKTQKTETIESRLNRANESRKRFQTHAMIEAILRVYKNHL